MSERLATRIAWIDITKATAAWMVVTAHLLRQGVLTDYLAAVSVAVFYMLAGVTLHAHDDMRAFLGRLLRRIVLPYLVVGLVSIVIYRVLGSYAADSLGTAVAETTLWQDLFHLLYGSSVHGWMKWNESLWFLPCYSVTILLAEGFEHVGQRWRLLQVVLYLGCGVVGYSLIRCGVTGLPWHLETALLVLPLCGLGRYMQQGILAQRRSWVMILAGAAFVVSTVQKFGNVERAAGGSFSLRAPQLAGAETTYLFLILSTTGVIYLVKGLAQYIDFPAWVRAVGAHSLDIVLWNKFPVLFLQVVVPVLLPGVLPSYIGGMTPPALLAAAILAIPCMALCVVWSGLYQYVLRRLRHGTRSTIS